jgi:hypothetical protein
VISPEAVLHAVRRHMSGPFLWGSSDCCTAACAALGAMGGGWPLKEPLPPYSGCLGALRIVSRAGGYEAWCFDQIIFPPTENPAPGDLVLIRSLDAFKAALAICVNPGEYAAKTENGLALTSSPIIGAWSCHL